MRQILSVLKALGDENRVRIILLLEANELCVCQILEVFDLAPSTVSKHLSILYQAGLLDSKKEGRWVYYRLADQNADQSVQESIAWVIKMAKDSEQAKADRVKLNEIWVLNPEELCKIQASRCC